MIDKTAKYLTGKLIIRYIAACQVYSTCTVSIDCAFANLDSFSSNEYLSCPGGYGTALHLRLNARHGEKQPRICAFLDTQAVESEYHALLHKD